MSLTHKFDPRESPTRATHEKDPKLNPQVRPKSLTHELDPYKNDPPNIVSSPPPLSSPAEAGGKWISQKTAANSESKNNYFCSQRGRLHFRLSIFLKGDQRFFFNIFVFVILWSSVKDTKS